MNNPPDLYHIDFSRDSHSSLEIFRRAIEEYAAVRVHRTIPPPAPTPAMLFGAAFHTYVLEPEKFRQYYVIPPSFDRRTTVGKIAAAAWDTTHGDLLSITQEDMNLMAGMLAGLGRNKFAAAVIAGEGTIETPIEWTDEQTGTPLKCRPDKVLKNGLIVDLKTCVDIEPGDFARAVANFGYHRQAALYLEGCKTIGAEGPFLFIAVSKRPPHETVCYTLDYAALELGNSQNLLTLAELAERRLKADWSGRWGNRIETLSLPRWALLE